MAVIITHRYFDSRCIDTCITLFIAIHMHIPALESVNDVYEHNKYVTSKC